ncbi:MAG TPA: endolytic transglycosylase MltG [bacterium]|nr:endolytic transglycosylase MltG [bacterium]HPL95344.1 endolytic transglycosylase MltG [bacterium]
MSKTTKTIIFLIIIFLIILVGFIIYQIYVPTNFSGEKEFVIARGESLNQIGRHLVSEKIIKSQLAFEFYIYLAGLESSLQAGNYVLTPMNIAKLATTFSVGKVDNEITLTLTEGQTINDLADVLLQNKIIANKKDLLELTKINNFKNDYDFLKDIPENNLEGFLFPDTYLIYKDALSEDVVKKMLDNFSIKITPFLLTEIKAQGKNLYEILIMASILEKEVQTENDMKIVAGILWKRLDANMALQVDSSLKYIIGGGNPSLTLNELQIDSPYNTYKYRGLPPTPIGNPGLSAIRAAIYPKTSDYWFYLSNQESKETIFSKTYQEHEAAINQHLR